MLNKKGAVEFSMTTIIVVIIGVIILAIAIPWITGTLNKAGGLTDAAFDSALKQLQADPTPSEPVVLSQDSFTLKRGEQVNVMGVYKFGPEYKRLAYRFQQLRAKKGIKIRILMTKKGKPIADLFSDCPPIEVRFMKESLAAPSIFLI